VIAKADSTLAITSLSDLAGKKVSVGVGTALEQELKQANEELKTAGKPLINIVSMPSTADAIQQLIAGLSDAYYGSTDQVSFFNKERPGFAKLVSPQLSALYTGIATLHKDKDMHEAFAAALKAIMTSGEYQAVLTKWGFEGLKVQ
jgi:polar amino acid transport system substrate-binding protein